VAYVTGYVIFDVLLSDFYDANGGSATGVDRDPPIIWAGLVAGLAYAAAILYALRGQAASLNVASGMKAGAVVGFLIWACVDFTFYSTTNINNLTLAIVDPLVEIVHGGIIGAALALVLPKLGMAR
jgi:hypothetical protein